MYKNYENETKNIYELVSKKKPVKIDVAKELIHSMSKNLLSLL